MRTLRQPLPALLALCFGACVLAWVAFPLPRDVRVAAIDVLLSAVAFAAAASLWGGARRLQNADLRRSYLLLGGGCLAWGLGGLAWAYFEVVARTEPFPSVADIGYLAAIPLFGAAILAWPGAVQRRPWSRWAMPAVSALLAALTAFELLVEPFLGSLAGAAAWIALAYPAFDLVLLATLVLVLGLVDVRERARLLVVGAAIVFLLAADALFQQGFGWGSVTFEAANLGWALAFGLLGATPLVSWGWANDSPRRNLSIVGTVVATLVAAVIVKEFAEDDASSGFERFDSLLFGVIVVALVWLSWRAAAVLSHAQKELAHQSALRRATMDASRTGNCVFTSTGDAAFWNSAFVDILGLPPSGCPTWAALVGHLQGICAESGTTIVAAAGHSARCRTSAGRHFEVRFEEIATGDLLVSVDDITAREREAATRARFVAQVVGAQEAETRRIATLLHDDAVQQLTALGLRLELAALKSGDGSFDTLAASANRVTASVRSLLVQLHPAVLESQGLRAAIEVAAEPLRVAGLRVRVSSADERHPVETEQLVYRLVQEAFANVLKHAGARRVDVELSSEQDALRVRVADDGDGFDVGDLETAVARGHLGLHLLRERVEIAGGSAEVASSFGGTTVAFELPLVREHARGPIPEKVPA